MLWLGVKVLLVRQMYGFKHRKVMIIFSLVIPVILTIILRGILILPPIKYNNDTQVQRYLYSNSGSHNGDTGFFKFPHPLRVIVLPENLNTSNLMAKAQNVLRCGNLSNLDLNLTFAESPEDMNRSLADSVWPSIGVGFHEVTTHQLKYTLHPVVASNIPENFTGDDDISPYSLLLQAAIDAAYKQTYFPDEQSSFSKLQNFEETDITQEKIITAVLFLAVYLSHTLLTFSILILIIFLATYNIRDKANGVRELMCISGLPRWMVNVSWLWTFSLLATLIVIVEVIILKIPTARLQAITTAALLVSLIIYYLTATFFVYLITNIFKSQIVSVLLIIIYFVVISPFFWRVSRIENYFVAQAFVSLLPNVGSIMFCVAALESYTEFKHEISITNMFSTTGKFISPGLVLVMMIISIFMLLALGLYFDAVKPGPYGRARPWYLFTRKEEPTTDHWIDAQAPSEALAYEPINDKVPVGLECVNIVKKFGTNKVLNKVNLKIVKNSITVLLGHNGAGKTTLFSILSGMFSPTSGQVFTDQYNVFEGSNIKKFRTVLGYCPQENLLMRELTVHEHLIIFGLLKGLAMSEAADYSDMWIRMFDMYTMRQTQAKNLSGGSKRKLCLAIAMTGDPQYLLLDEPSAGMDIESTLNFSEILLEEKRNCTVIITTQNMDEAEMLGDRIAILAHGELKCYGSASFLKKMLDTGYRLNCSITRGMNIQEAIKAVTNTIPGATVLYRTNHFVTFSVPVNKTKDIPDLLRQLESRFGTRMSVALSHSSLDDVFLKVQKDMGVKIAIDAVPSISEEKYRRSCWNFTELFKKRVKSLLTHKVVTWIFIVILLPNLIMVIFMSTVNISLGNTKPDNDSWKRLMIDSISKGGLGISALLSDAYTSGFSQPTPVWEAFRVKRKNMNSTIGNSTKIYVFKYYSKILFALETQSSETPIMFSRDKADHDDVSKVYGALVNDFNRRKSSIITSSSPFMRQQTSNETMSSKCSTQDDFIIIRKSLTYHFSLSFLLASSYFIMFPHNERTTVFKHLQFMTGLLPVMYWFVNLVFDMLLYIVSCALVIIITASMDRTDVFLQPDVMWAFILILFLYGLSGITYSYVWSFWGGSNGWAFVQLLLFNVVLTVIVYTLFSLIWYWPGITKFLEIILPFLTLDATMNKLIDWAVKKRDCRNCPLGNHEESCFYMKLNPALLGVMDSELITLTVQASVWFILILLFDHGMGRKLKGGIDQAFCANIKTLDKNVDPEVALERNRVKHLVRNINKDKQPELTVYGLGKHYACAKTAVYDVTFAAERGECFGLVGVNGSGKTTTFGMLAALLSPTKGTAFIEGTWKLTGCEYNYLKRVGYCPQHNGLLTELSGRMILKLFGQLSGVPRSQINELVDKWINALDMAGIAKRPCGKYSGGNKRKLSLAIALISNAPVALLDEPTAGVDPVVRRRIWAILSHRLEENQTIILTSHTMSECEAICDRLTIMVKGVMKCLGPIPTLKKTLGKRSILEVKFTSTSTIKEQDVVKSKIESEFSGYITLEDRLLTRLKFTLNTENSKMHDLYASMLRIQDDYEIVEDFSLVEAPLEQVFMSFAKKTPLKKKYR